MLTAVAAAIVVVTACTSSSGAKNKNATATAYTVAELTATTGAPTPGPSPTPIDVASISFQPLTGTNYRIDIPQGWQPDGGNESRYVYFAGDLREAAVSVSCQPGKSIDDMMAEDNRAVGGRKGQYGIGAALSITIGGLNGRVVDYDVSPAGLPIEARTVYLVGSSCGWRIVFYAYSVGGRDRWAQLFQRVAESFQEVKSPPSG